MSEEDGDGEPRPWYVTGDTRRAPAANGKGIRPGYG
jgi:hypothetical protein